MRLGQAGLKIVGVPFSSGGRKKVFSRLVFSYGKLCPRTFTWRTTCTTHARMPADALAEAGRPLQRTTADAKNPQTRPRFEKHKAIQSNPPCGCPMGCGTLYGGEGVFWPFAAVPRGRLRVEGFSSSRLQLRLWKAGLGVVVVDFQGGRVACKGRSCIPDKWV